MLWYLWKLISLFYKIYPEKPEAIFLLISSALSIAIWMIKTITKAIPKEKWGKPPNSVYKQAKKN